MAAGTLVGHEKRWAALARAFAKKKLPQTLLISGPPQVGKFFLARRFAQLLLCQSVVQDKAGLPAPCGACRVCHQVEIETFPDFSVYRPIVSSAKEEKDWIIAPDAMEGSIITVDVARKFGNKALARPLAGSRKVMVLNQAERMNLEAQNALLKTFEEPVSSLTIILLSDNPNQLLPTVLSRAWHLPLGLVPDEEIRAWLQRSFEAPSTVVEEAVRVAAGRPGAAWRELQRLQGAPAGAKKPGAKAAKASEANEGDELPRFVQATRIVDRIVRSQPVGALGLTEEALRLAKLWWAQDQAAAEARKESSKGDAKVLRSAVARFLDELSLAYRARWVSTVEGQRNAATHAVWADGLDQIRKTRHYILRNANTNLALDVMFGRLIALQQATQTVATRPPGQSSQRPGTRPVQTR
jgi:hypothetical protein